MNKVLVTKGTHIGLTGYIQRWYDDETAILCIRTPTGNSQGWAYHLTEFTYI